MALLEIENLYVRFDTKEGSINAVNGVDLAVEENSIVAMVGGKRFWQVRHSPVLRWPSALFQGG